jgi:acetyl esterase/lipase
MTPVPGSRELGVVVVSVDYRLSPGTPFPGPLDDCYAALRWMARESATHGIDSTRIALTGESAGGGLPAALAQMARDRGEVAPAFQSLVYPMLDDRTVLRHDHDGRGEFIWSPGSNRAGWKAFLGHAPAAASAPEYAAPARRVDLLGLPPAWIGVGTLDLFYPENVEYARRLVEAGVPCDLHVVEGAYHGFDGFRGNAHVSREFNARRLDAIRHGLALA